MALLGPSGGNLTTPLIGATYLSIFPQRGNLTSIEKLQAKPCNFSKKN